MDTKLKQKIESFIVDYANNSILLKDNIDYKVWMDGAFELLIQTLEKN